MASTINLYSINEGSGTVRLGFCHDKTRSRCSMYELFIAYIFLRCLLSFNMVNVLANIKIVPWILWGLELKKNIGMKFPQRIHGALKGKFQPNERNWGSICVPKVDPFPILGDVHSLIPPFIKGILINLGIYIYINPLRELRVSHLPMEIMGVFNRPMSCLPKKTKLTKQLADRK